LTLAFATIQEQTINEKRIGWAGNVADMAKKRNVYRVSGRNPEVRRSFGRPKRRWEAIIKIDLNYDGGGIQDLSGSGQGQVARCCEHGNEPAGYIECGELRDYTRKWLRSKHCAPFSQPARRPRNSCLVSYLVSY
jgi:hypothetical protein